MIRLQKYIADCGVASRRSAEEMIVNSRVRVNGEIVSVLGTKVSPGDKVEVDGVEIRPVEEKIYIILNKPVGYVTTLNDQFGRKIVTDLLKGVKTRVFPVGRLDMDTSGLLFLTNDGELANSLAHPSYEIKKTYEATVDMELGESELNSLRNGVVIDGKKTSNAIVELIKKPSTYSVVIHEGRNRQVRKMFEAVGANVVALKRVRYGDFTLKGLNVGEWRYLSNLEINRLKNGN